MGILGIFRDFWDFWGFKGFLGVLGILGIFSAKMCWSDFSGVITGVSVKIRMCQPTRILSANKAGMCGFLKMYDGLLDGVKISRRGLVRISEN